MRALATLAAGMAGLVAHAPLEAAVSARPTYLLSMHLHDGKRLIGSPSLRMAAGEMAIVSINEVDGEHYRVCVTAMPDATGKVAIASTVDVTSFGRHATTSPRVVVAYGERRALAVNAADGRATAFRLDLTVTRAAG